MRWLCHKWGILVWLALLNLGVCRASPCLSFPKEGVTFGEITIGSNIISRIELRNTGARPVSVSRVKACCGATAELRPQTVKPDGLAILSVSFKPKSIGAFAKTLQISCNDPECPIVNIPMTGVVVEVPGESTMDSKCNKVAWASVFGCIAVWLMLAIGRWMDGGEQSNGNRVDCTDVKRCLLIVCRVGVGCVFLYAGAAKLCDVNAFVDLVVRYEVLPAALTGVCAFGIMIAELAFGVLLILGKWVRFSAGAVSIMLVMFIGALAQAVIRGLDISCGCFGGASTTGSAGIMLAIGRDVLLLAFALVLIFAKRHSRQI